MQEVAQKAVDGAILPPVVRIEIRTAAKQPMQNGEEHRALQRKIIFAQAGEAFDDVPTAGLLPQAFKDQSRPDAPRRTRCDAAGGGGVDDDRLLGEARARTQQPLQLAALAQILDPAHRGDQRLANPPPLPSAFATQTMLADPLSLIA